MKFLIITQVIDTEHPILGFFHRWVEEFAKHCEKVHVICLYEGIHELPANVVVHSLGKDEGKSRLTYVYRFYKLIWQLRHEYDNVFVHMNQVYVILGSLVWRLLSKKVGLWYAHGAVTWTLKFAVWLTDAVFTSTVGGMRIDTPKRIVVGQGVDIERFKLSTKKISPRLRLITVGRIAQSKNIDTLLNSCAKLKEAGLDFTFRIVGLATTREEKEYEQEMKKLVWELDIQEEVVWVGPLSQSVLPNELQAADIFVNDGATNSLDKALLEAVLCGCLVVSSNPSYHSLITPLVTNLYFEPRDFRGLTKIILQFSYYNQLQMTEKMKPVRDFILNKYSVSNLISGIVSKY